MVISLENSKTSGVSLLNLLSLRVYVMADAKLTRSTVYISIFGVSYDSCMTRLYVLILGNCLCPQITWSLLGVTIQYCTSNNGARLFGYYIIVGFTGALSQLFAIPSANVTG